METLDRHATGLAVQNMAPAASMTWTARPERRPRRNLPLMRKYEVAGLTATGTVVTLTHIAPAMPHLDEVVSAFAHGTLIETPSGPIAIEDLRPGQMLRTSDAGAQRLLWVGSTVLAAAPESEAAPPVTRITADCLGPGRPISDLVLGPRARLVVRHPGCRALCGSDAALVPASALTDGTTLIALRPTWPVRLYHLGLARQYILLANGVEVESYHPGENALELLEPGTRQAFLALFPHLRGRAAFGEAALPRLTTFEFETLSSA
ncbi:Hint domain-containing protein [Rhodovulum bhavnagarense]|uniref:Hint domain-containing protein n=1 Tax=Rhodovulum bhavnagarense TaxID=992286 RepID=A0A4R2RVE7_9RHOB|nr:Hint domain-containing protein [Rhodovulum bhavnagarense]TCP63105.1 Hint domain-containing protein [Rhodovulum bhavnagarense]